jgi:hypothetical protein
VHRRRPVDVLHNLGKAWVLGHVMGITLLAPLKSSRTSRRRAPSRRKPARRTAPRQDPLARDAYSCVRRRVFFSVGAVLLSAVMARRRPQTPRQRPTSMRDGVLNVSHSRALAREHLVPRIGPFHDLRVPAWAFATALLQSRRSGHCIRGRSGSCRGPLHHGRMDVARGSLIGRSSAAERARKAATNRTK